MRTNRISCQVKEYLEYKRSLGFKLKADEIVLKGFVQYTLEKDYDGSLCKDIVLDWIASGVNSDKTMGRKLEVIMPFSKYAAAFDENAVVINKQIFSNVRARPAPYIYTEDETIKLMKQCSKLYSPDGIRALSVATVIGLLWSCGLRPSEPINLTVGDVNTDECFLHIRKTKFLKERIIPIDKSVAKKLYEYKCKINEKLGLRLPDMPFFYTTHGKPLTERALEYAFKLIRPCINANPVGYPYVRLYDFRHTMACRTIQKWTEQGIDVNKNLYILSTYLGHVRPQDTYWYISSTPEIMKLSCLKYEETFGGDFDEE